MKKLVKFLNSALLLGGASLMLASCGYDSKVKVDGIIYTYLGEDVYFNGNLVSYNEDAYAVTGYGYKELPENVNIQSEINGLPVKYIFKDVFADTEIKTVKLPDSLLTIDDAAFMNCMNLSSINIPDSLIYLGSYAFMNCSSITSITLPDSLETIDYAAFMNCMNLSSINIPNYLINLRNHAFENCSSITSITLPDSLTSIPTYAFYGCTSLSSVELGNYVTEIQEDAFSDAPISEISLPDTLTWIGSGAFRDCSSLKSVTIPSAVNFVGSSSFRDCTSLKEVVFKNTEGWSIYDVPEYFLKNYLKEYNGRDVSVTDSSLNASNMTTGDYVGYSYCRPSSMIEN